MPPATARLGPRLGLGRISSPSLEPVPSHAPRARYFPRHLVRRPDRPTPAAPFNLVRSLVAAIWRLISAFFCPGHFFKDGSFCWRVSDRRSRYSGIMSKLPMMVARRVAMCRARAADAATRHVYRRSRRPALLRSAASVPRPRTPHPARTA